jgi:hypothetical protein
MVENQDPDFEQQTALGGKNVKASPAPSVTPEKPKVNGVKTNKATEQYSRVRELPKENTEPENQHLTDPEFNFYSKVGDLDPIGRRIEAIYFSSDQNYFIYHIGNYSLEIVAVDGSLLSKNSKANEIYGRILDYFASNAELKRKYVKSIAFAIKTLYDGDSEIAINILEATYKNITRFLKRKAELAYLLGAITLMFIGLITYFLTYKAGNLNDFGHIIFCALIFSSLGGFLSVALNVKNLDVDVQNSFPITMFYGAQRVFLAMISGVFIYFLISSKIFLAFFENLQNINIYYVAFFLCGFSERLVPNLMLNFEKDKSMFKF